MPTCYVFDGSAMEQGTQSQRRKTAVGNAEAGPCMKCWWEKESQQRVEKRKPERE